MKFFFLLVMTVIFSSNISSQEILFEKEVKLKSFFLNKDKKESFPVVNNENKEIGMFLLDKKEIKSYIFDVNYVLKDSFTTTRPKGKYNTLLGNTYNHKTYTLFFTNEKKTKFSTKSINISDKKSAFKELGIKLKGEEFLESIKYSNKLYIVTVKRAKSILKVYEFRGEEKVRIKKIDLSEERFTKANKSLFYVLFRTTSAIKEEIVLNKIDNRNPNAIDQASYVNKIYCFNNTIYITLDVYDDYTKVISINLTNFDSKVKDYPFAKVDCEYDLGVRSNSYLLGDNIYQVSGCKNELYFSISDIKSGSKFKEWNFKKNEVISFKNTPLIQLGGAFNRNIKYRELDDTKEILKKIEAGNIGVSVYKPKENVEITIGGYKKMVTKKLIATALIGGLVVGTNPTIGPANRNYYSNPTMYGYQNYSNTRSVYFKSLFNNKLESIKGSLKENAFDKIRKFANKNYKNTSAETIFRVNNYYVLGFYKKNKKKYYLLKFVD